MDLIFSQSENGYWAVGEWIVIFEKIKNITITDENREELRECGAVEKRRALYTANTLKVINILHARNQILSNISIDEISDDIFTYKIGNIIERTEGEGIHYRLDFSVEQRKALCDPSIRQYFSGILRLFYDNGRIKSETNYVEGIIHGNCMFYFDNGIMGLFSQYSHGKPEGIWISSYPNGTIERKDSFLDGELHGEQSRFSELGIPLRIYYCKNGKTDGINLSFYENGKLTEKSTWINGKIDGIREQYDINGNLELKQIYED